MLCADNTVPGLSQLRDAAARWLTPAVDLLRMRVGYQLLSDEWGGGQLRKKLIHPNVVVL